MITRTLRFVGGKKIREYHGLEGAWYQGTDVNEGIKSY